MPGFPLRRLLPLYALYRRWLRKPVSSLFFMDLLGKTSNFGDVTWLGRPIWQNVLDLWTIQETIFEVKPRLIVETGTNRGGSSLFYAHLFDLMGQGQVLTIDVERLHDVVHPRIDFLLGSSIAPEIVAQVDKHVRRSGAPVMVILDSDHAEAHVARELELYAPFVTKGSFLLVQDGVIDRLPVLRAERPGPLGAIRGFLRRNAEFQVDSARCERFLISHHPSGWLRRVSVNDSGTGAERE